jgi:hypothetical protein
MGLLTFSVNPNLNSCRRGLYFAAGKKAKFRIAFLYKSRLPYLFIKKRRPVSRAADFINAYCGIGADSILNLA